MKLILACAILMTCVSSIGCGDDDSATVEVVGGAGAGDAIGDAGTGSAEAGLSGSPGSPADNANCDPRTHIICPDGRCFPLGTKCTGNDCCGEVDVE